MTDFSTSWRNGLAFCAIIHRHRPDLLDYDNDCSPYTPTDNLKLAYTVAEQKLNIMTIDSNGKETFYIKSWSSIHLRELLTYLNQKTPKLTIKFIFRKIHFVILINPNAAIALES